MGIYLNPGNREFQRALNEDIYIDKTDLIAYTNDRLGKFSRYLCVSRPRRFGKSMAADMLVSYYSKGCHSEILFSDKKIAACPSYPEHLNRHHVIRIDVQQFLCTKEDAKNFIDDIQRLVMEELREEFSECAGLQAETRLQRAFNRIFSRTGGRVCLYH